MADPDPIFGFNVHSVFSQVMSPTLFRDDLLPPVLDDDDDDFDITNRKDSVFIV